MQVDATTITDDQIRAVRRARPELLDSLMVAIHSEDLELKKLHRQAFADILNAGLRLGCRDLDPNWPDTDGRPRGSVLCVSYPRCSCGEDDRVVRTTGKTITDAQISKLRVWLFARGKGDSLELAGLVATHDALGRSHRRDAARIRCAALLNRLSTEECPGRAHAAHAVVTCNGACCSACGGPVDDNEACRC